MTPLSLHDAATYQDSFTAVMDGSANDAQCQEVIAVAQALGGYLREAALRAVALPERRDDFLSLVSDQKKAAIEAIVGSDPDQKPRIVLDPKTGTVGTPEEIAALSAKSAQVLEQVAG